MIFSSTLISASAFDLRYAITKNDSKAVKIPALMKNICVSVLPELIIGFHFAKLNCVNNTASANDRRYFLFFLEKGDFCFAQLPQVRRFSFFVP